MQIAIPSNLVSVPPLPSAAQIAWLEGELGIFVHFGLNTFTGREWGDGTESPSLFNPPNLDPGNWAAAAKSAGARHLVLTAKHHDGFCLWPTATTTHSVKYSPWKAGRGDVVKEFVAACRSHGLLPGLYLSPWDRNAQCYGDSSQYNEFYLRQLKELLGNYGPVAEIWFDGACAEGPNGKQQAYDFPAYFRLCKELQPQAVTMGDGGTDVRWIGNERGVAGDPCWSIVDSTLVRYPGDSGSDMPKDARPSQAIVAQHLQHGDPTGDTFRPGECDVSIRPGWFYHDHENESVRSPENLVDLYCNSVGRNAFLLLNVPPTPQGVFHDHDVQVLQDFRAQLNRIFSNDLARYADIVQQENCIHLSWHEPVTFDLIDIREKIELGQRVKSHRIETLSTNGRWSWLKHGTTLGRRCLHRVEPVTAIALRILVEDSRGTPAICEVGLYKRLGQCR